MRFLIRTHPVILTYSTRTQPTLLYLPKRDQRVDKGLILSQNPTHNSSSTTVSTVIVEGMSQYILYFDNHIHLGSYIFPV